MSVEQLILEAASKEDWVEVEHKLNQMTIKELNSLSILCDNIMTRCDNTIFIKGNKK